MVPRLIRLVDGERKIAYVLYAYEGIDGGYCLNLETGARDAVNVSWLNGTTRGYNAGQASIFRDGEGNLGLEYYDYKTGETRSAAIPLGDLPEGASAFSYDDTLATGRSATVVLVAVSSQDGEEMEARLYRYWHDSGTMERLDFGINLRYAPATLLAVTDDGRALLRYGVNNAERGLLLVG